MANNKQSTSKKKSSVTRQAKFFNMHEKMITSPYLQDYETNVFGKRSKRLFKEKSYRGLKEKDEDKDYDYIP